MASQHGIIRIIYLYLFALVGLFMMAFSVVNFVGAILDRFILPQEYVDYNIGLKPFPGEERTTPEIPQEEVSEAEKREQFTKQQNNDFKRRVNQSVPGAIIGFFLWWFHWGWIKRDRDGK